MNLILLLLSTTLLTACTSSEGTPEEDMRSHKGIITECSLQAEECKGVLSCDDGKFFSFKIDSLPLAMAAQSCMKGKCHVMVKYLKGNRLWYIEWLRDPKTEQIDGIPENSLPM